MSSNITITETNYITGSPSTYQYSFPSNINMTNKEIALASVDLYYSWFNITNGQGAGYMNNTFQYIWIDGTTITVTIPNGFYQIEDINNVLISTMVANGHYLIDGNGDYNFYLMIQNNVPQYAVQINSTFVPTSLPAGWSVPAAATWAFPVSASNPQFVVQVYSTSNFGSTIGFVAGSYPAAQTPGSNQSFLSTSVPNLTPVNSIIVQCDLLFNPYSSNSFNLATFSPVGATFASNLEFQPNEYAWQNCSSGNRQTFTLRFMDENLMPIYFQDKTLSCMLLIRDKPQYDLGKSG